MPSCLPTQTLIHVLTDALADVRTPTQQRIVFSFHPSEREEHLFSTRTTLKEGDEIVDIVEYGVAADVFSDLDEARLRCFAEGVRAARAISWDETREEFPPWALLQSASLKTADDFIRAMATPEARRGFLDSDGARDEHDRVIEVINEALGDARTVDQRRVTVSLSRYEDTLSVQVALFDEHNEIVDAREWQVSPLPFPRALSDERLRGFAAGLRAASRSLDWEALYPEFPGWPLLSSAALNGEADFIRALASAETRHDALAADFVERMRATLDLGPLPAAAGRQLFALSLGTSSQAELEQALDELGRAAEVSAPYVIALFERWADEVDERGYDDWITRDGGSLKKSLASHARSWLVERGPVYAERVEKLVARGFLDRPPPDFDALFNGGPEVKIVEVGAIDVPSGLLVACDPFREGSPLDVSLAPGRYPVRAAQIDLREWGRRIAALRLDVKAEPATRWRTAGEPFFVDAGLACFMSLEAHEAFATQLGAFADRTPPGNYYDEVLAAVLLKNATPDRINGDWGLHTFGDGQQMAVSASGIGDGIYTVYAGENDAGDTVALVIDFALAP